MVFQSKKIQQILNSDKIFVFIKILGRFCSNFVVGGWSIYKNPTDSEFWQNFHEFFMVPLRRGPYLSVYLYYVYWSLFPIWSYYRKSVSLTFMLQLGCDKEKLNSQWVSISPAVEIICTDIFTFLRKKLQLLWISICIHIWS